MGDCVGLRLPTSGDWVRLWTKLVGDLVGLQPPERRDVGLAFAAGVYAPCIGSWSYSPGMVLGSFGCRWCLTGGGIYIWNNCRMIYIWNATVELEISHSMYARPNILCELVAFY